MSIYQESWRTIKIEHDALWLLVFNHSTSFGFFHNPAHAGFSFDEGLFSIMSRINRRSYANRYNQSYEFLLEYPNEFQNQYNRWLQSKDPLSDPQINGIETNASGYRPIHIDWSDLNWGGLKKGRGSAIIDGNVLTSYWNYGIGDYIGEFKDKTAGPRRGGCVTLINLWLRISIRPFIATNVIRRTATTWLFFVCLFICV